MMPYYPFIEFIEYLLDKAKKFGSWLYWVWILTAAIPGGIAFSMLMDGKSLSDTETLWILTGLLFIIPLPLVMWHEHRRDNK